IGKVLVENYNGKVPDEIDELLKLKGVGRKTANLVVALGYGKPAICVDTHVHRISNRLGYVNTKAPEQTEFTLRKKLPKKYWIIYNDLLVAWGQNICVPISPWCSRCAIRKYCRRVGVDRSR
ncbi:endonuclease III, partial [Candidatus Woesearchaeota archaeon]|nr:endonuclease III [Candidatus Woesearchaeota archaeon]